MDVFTSRWAALVAGVLAESVIMAFINCTSCMISASLSGTRMELSCLSW